MAINFGVKLGDKLPACSDPRITCENVRADFQPYARAMLRALNISDWANDRFDQPAKLCKIVDRYLHRERAATKMQEMLAGELVRGECKAGSLSSRTAPSLSASAGGGKNTSSGPLGKVPKIPAQLSKDVHADKLESVVGTLVRSLDGAATTGVGAAADGVVGFVGIKAMGGQGKTTLLARVARDPRVLARFSSGVVWIDVGREATEVGPLLAQMARWLKIDVDDGEKDLDAAIAAGLRRTLSDDGNDLLILLDNVWSSSLVAAQKLIEACSDRIKVVLTSRELSVMEELRGDSVDLSELPLATAVKMLREQCRGEVELSDGDAEALARACHLHVLALEHVGAQLWRKCRGSRRSGSGGSSSSSSKAGRRRGRCTPDDVRKLIQDRTRSLSEKFKAKGKRANVDACLGLSLEGLEEEGEAELLRKNSQ